MQGLLVFLTLWTVFPQAAEGAPARENLGSPPTGFGVGGRHPMLSSFWGSLIQRVWGSDPTPRLREGGGTQGEVQLVDCSPLLIVCGCSASLVPSRDPVSVSVMCKQLPLTNELKEVICVPDEGDGRQTSKPTSPLILHTPPGPFCCPFCLLTKASLALMSYRETES